MISCFEEKIEISVIINTYNHERYIEKAVESVLDQTLDRKKFEIIVVDDGSTDNTSTLLNKYEGKIQYIKKENGGQSSCLNVGLGLAKGHIISFLDGDDWWHREKLERIYQIFSDKPEIGAIGHGYIEIYEKGTVASYDGNFMPREVIPYKEEYTFNLKSIEGALLFKRSKCFLGTTRLSVRRSVLQSIIPIPEVLFYGDEYLFTCISAVANVLVIKDILFYYRLHDSNLWQSNVYRKENVVKNKNYLHILTSILEKKLKDLRISEDIIEMILHQNRISFLQMQLSIEGGKLGEAFYVEKMFLDELGLGKNMSFSRKTSLVLAKYLPPRFFYALKRGWVKIKVLHKRYSKLC